MGNTLSKKIDNNGKIWLETIRNFKIGCMFGLFLTLLKYRRHLYRLIKAWRKSRKMKNQTSPLQSPSKLLSSDSFISSTSETPSPLSYKSSPHKTGKSRSNLYDDAKLSEMFIYGIKFPLFIAGFSIIFKKLIRMNYISSALDVNTLTLPEQKHSIALMSFLLAYSMQFIFAFFGVNFH